MALTPGTRIGPYEVTGSLGAAGLSIITQTSSPSVRFSMRWQQESLLISETPGRRRKRPSCAMSLSPSTS